MAQERPVMVFPIETKNKGVMVDRIRQCLQFQHIIVVTPIGLSGDLALLWNNEASMKVEDSSANLINVICKESNRGRNFKGYFFVCSSHLSRETSAMAENENYKRSQPPPLDLYGQLH